ncbi:cytochrome C peroxidase [Akkermansiaceae bacterium]|nr:cytochrome C peroxidase [Akkermansiaceae bacterium]
MRALFMISGIFLPSVMAAPLQVAFVHEADGKPLALDSLRHTNAAGETFSVSRLDWLATGFSVTTADGATHAYGDAVAFVSGKGGGVALGEAPGGRITSLTFHIGPDEKTNHGDPARHAPGHPLNPNANRLHWDWQGGYIFLAAEGLWRKAGAGNEALGGFAYHFARDPNRTRVTLPVDLEARDASRVVVSLDAIKLLDGLSFAADGATTHSIEGDPVVEKLKAGLASAFRVAGIETAAMPLPASRPEPIDLPSEPEGYPLTLPRHVPLPSLPLDNPLLVQRVALGERLFNEPKLSRTNAISCASCHQGEEMSDPRRFSPGVDGKHGSRHAMPLFNLAWKSSFFWDGRAPSLREQVLVPIEDPLEMDETLENVVAKLTADPAYPPLFQAAFGSGKITPENIGLALENFLLTRVSFDSKFDRAFVGKETLTTQEKRGFELFFTESEPRMGRRGADCFHCHGGADFTDHSFHNNGLSTTDDVGLGKTTGLASDRYKFSTPSLRNIARTAPYMHDGRFATLEEVIEHYNSPPKPSATLDPNLAKHPQGLGLDEEDKAALIEFLKTL